MFHGVIPKHLLNKHLCIPWPYCDKYGEFIVNVLEKKLLQVKLISICDI